MLQSPCKDALLFSLPPQTGTRPLAPSGEAPGAWTALTPPIDIVVNDDVSAAVDDDDDDDVDGVGGGVACVRPVASVCRVAGGVCWRLSCYAQQSNLSSGASPDQESWQLSDTTDTLTTLI